MKTLFITLMLISNLGFACERSYYAADINSLMKGSSPDVIKMNCADKPCVCADGFSYPIDTNLSSIAMVVEGSLVADPVKETAMKIDGAEKQAVVDQKKAEDDAALSKLDDPANVSIQDLANAIKALKK